jgi:hypothetical protein
MPREGAWYAVPLDSGGWGLVLVARYNKKAAPLGYFFGPKRRELTDISVEHLGPDDAVAIRIFGHRGIIDGSWPLVQAAPPFWDRKDWPVPPLLREAVSDDEKYEWVVQYDDEVVDTIKEQRVKAGTVKGLNPNAMPGYLSMQTKLTNILDKAGKKSATRKK